MAGEQHERAHRLDLAVVEAVSGLAGEQVADHVLARLAPAQGHEPVEIVRHLAQSLQRTGVAIVVAGPERDLAQGI